MDWYRVIKTIKGRRYVYEQKTWREGGKVKTKSRYIGPAGDLAGGVAGEQWDNTTREVIGLLFDPGERDEEWKVPWRYDDAVAEAPFEVDARLFAVVARMGMAGKTRAHWGGMGSIAGDRWVATMEDGAVFYPKRNWIQIPAVERFESAAQFEGALLHEMAHATKALIGRLPRRADIVGGSIEAERRHGQNYAEEELVAETTANLVLAWLGHRGEKQRRQSATYVQGWLAECEDAEAAKRWAIREAQRAAEYLIGQWQAVNTTRLGIRQGLVVY